MCWGVSCALPFPSTTFSRCCEVPRIQPQEAEVAGWLWVPGNHYPTFQLERDMESFTPASFRQYGEKILQGFRVK